MDARDPTIPAAPDGGAAAEDVLARGETVGRYVVLHAIDGGAMGMVYAAFDPELDRKVALKLLRPELSRRLSPAEARGRLVREAQALARLAHPNVVGVHDVGTLDERVFIAMEFIDGVSLSQWIERVRPNWREILRVLIDAGRGLQAAHEADLVHRDFKPDNMLISADGRVRVVDFGLARAADERPAASEVDLERAQTEVGSGGALNTPLTRTGALLGTPAYMAPEQLARTGADARSDQFSFCVTAFEALYGKRPFAGDTLALLFESIVTGEPAPIENSPVPVWVRKVLARGLRPDREERFADMRELLAEVTRDRTKKQRRWAGAGIAIALLSLAGVVYRSASHQRAAMCRASFSDVWNDAQRNRVRSAFHGTGISYADEAANKTVQGLDDAAQRWETMHRDACEATYVRHEQSSEALDLRMHCLGESHDHFKALVEVLSNPDRKVVDNGPTAAANAVDIDRCADLESLKTGVPLPSNPDQRRELEALRNRVPPVTASFDAGKYEQALSAALEIRNGATAIGYSPLLADVECILGQTYERLGRLDEAEHAYRECIDAAERSRLDGLAASGWVELAHIVGYERDHYEAGLNHLRHADALAARSKPDLDLRYRLLRTRGLIFELQARYSEAEAVLQEARALAERSPQRALVLPKALNNLGFLHRNNGQLTDAMKELQQSLDMKRAFYGTEHPELVITAENLAEVFTVSGKIDEAIQLFRSALAVSDRSLGPRHLRTGYIHGALCSALQNEHHLNEALLECQLARSIIAELQGEDSADAASATAQVGDVLCDLGRRKEGADLQKGALVLLEKFWGKDHPDLVNNLKDLVQCLIDAGRPEEALPIAQRAVGLGAGAPRLILEVGAKFELARAQWATSNRSGALRTAREALALANDSKIPAIPGGQMKDKIKQWIAAHE
jgi:tetratricopeptide (TPR) repeat protein/tRNA A-37 threonylcarbamoyl transferase component Bud32